MAPCEAVGLRVGRQAGRAICFTLLKVLVGLSENSAPGTIHFLLKKEKERERPATQAQHGACTAMPLRPTHWSCTAVSLPFLPVPVPVLYGRLPHSMEAEPFLVWKEDGLK